MFDGRPWELDFIILRNVWFHSLIARPTTDGLRDVLGSPAKAVHFNYKSQTAVLPMTTEYIQSRDSGSAPNSKDFTSKAEEGESFEGDKEKFSKLEE